MNRKLLAVWLREVADSIESGDSAEGRIQWLLSETPGQVLVDAAVRTGSLEGQGGCLTIFELPEMAVKPIAETTSPPRRLYMVACPEHTEGRLIVVSDSPEGAASFLQLLLLGYGDGREFKGAYVVHPVANDVGNGIWLSGYDGSDDLEALLRTSVPSYDKSNPFPLWGPAVEVRL